MKKLFLLLALVASPLLADVTANAPLPVRIDTQLSRFVAGENAKTCAKANLPPSCTDAQAKAVNPSLEVFATVNAYFGDKLAPLARRTAKEYQESLKTLFTDTLDSMTNAQQNQVCALLNAKNPLVPPTQCWP